MVDVRERLKLVGVTDERIAVLETNGVMDASLLRKLGVRELVGFGLPSGTALRVLRGFPVGSQGMTPKPCQPVEEVRATLEDARVSEAAIAALEQADMLCEHLLGEATISELQQIGMNWGDAKRIIDAFC